jgi:hypothetical protein
VERRHGERVRSLHRARGLYASFPIPTLFDPNYGVAEEYASTNCPRCWVIDEKGKVVYTSHPHDRPADVACTLQRYLAAGDDIFDIKRGRA